MRSPANLSTRSKLLLGFGVMLAFTAVVLGVGVWGLWSVDASAGRLYDQRFTNAVDLLDMRSNLNGQRVDVLLMMLLTDRAEQDVYRADLKERAARNDQLIDRMTKRNRDDPQFLAAFKPVVDLGEETRRVRDDQVVPLILDGKFEQAKQISLGPQERRYEQMRTMLRSLGDQAVDQATREIEGLRHHARTATAVVLAVGAVALAIGLLMALLLSANIANPLRQISTAAERIATGDLAVSMPANHRGDEVGALTGTFGRMVGSLQTIVAVAERVSTGDLRADVQPQSDRDRLGTALATMITNLRGVTLDITQGATVVASSASQIVASTAQLASSAAQTATAVAETTTTVEEVRQTAQLASDKARYVSDSAQRVAQVSQAGKRSTQETAEGMCRIREQMDSIAQGMVRLSEQSQAIGQIIATVDDLAQQSNLLAVNASIEAAKAGEQGKGFAVVAQEVKSLAEQSKQATAQVRAILSDVQKATNAAVMATEQGMKAVEAGVKQAAQSGESIESLAGGVAEAAQAATQIAASSQQQLIGVDQVAQAMQSIKQACAQNVESARELEAAARGLGELGGRLKDLVGRYKLQGDGRRS
jgi:methyl-accepting chemotaxis protein